MTDPLFVSIYAYAFAKAHRPQDLTAALHAELAKGEASLLPSLRTLHRLRRMFDVELSFSAATLITKARCVQAGAFLARGLPLWLQIDDDVDATPAALATLIEGAQGTRVHPPRLVSAAMKTRSGEEKMNLGVLGVDPTGSGRFEAREGELFRATYAACALTVIPRAELLRVCALDEVEWFYEDQRMPDLSLSPTLRCPAVFAEGIEGERWVSEDVAFFARCARADVPMYSFLHRGVTHAGIPLVSGAVTAHP